MFSTSEESNNHLMNWCLKFKFTADSTKSYSAGRMLSFGGLGTNLLNIITNEASNTHADNIHIILLKGLNNAPSSILTNSGPIPPPSSSYLTSLNSEYF